MQQVGLDSFGALSRRQLMRCFRNSISGALAVKVPEISLF
jgi:hypothetical protein